jgi:DnaK suppressor protein
MEATKTKEIRQRLSSDYQNLINSIERGRFAAEEIKVESTKDDGDRSSSSHDRDLVDNLNERVFARLRTVRQAIHSLNCSRFGECLGCGRTISERRLAAVPWATTCLQCQESTEADQTTARIGLARLDINEIEA